jgi:hypothetical protein
MASFFLDETRRLRTVWRFAIFGFGFLAVQIGLGIVLGIGLLIYLVMTDTSLNSFVGNPRLIEDWQLPLQMIAAIPMTLCTVVLVLLCRR